MRRTKIISAFALTLIIGGLVWAASDHGIYSEKVGAYGVRMFIGNAGTSSTGEIQVNSTGNIDIESGASVVVKSGGELEINSGGILDINGTATVGTLTVETSLVSETITLSDDILAVLEGDTADANEITIGVVEPTADVTYLFPDDAAATYIVMTSTLATNNSTAANSVIGVSNGLRFEGATADASETTLTLTDPTADNTITLGDFSGSVVMMIADTGTADGHTLVDGNTISTCTATIPDDALIAGGVLKVHAMGTFAGGNAAGAVSFMLDGDTNICKTTQATAGADDWVLDCTMYNVTAATQEIDCVLNADTDAAVVSTRSTDTTDFAGGDIVVAVAVESGHGSDTTTLESCQIFVSP